MTKSTGGKRKDKLDFIEIKCLFMNTIGGHHETPLHTPTTSNAGNAKWSSLFGHGWAVSYQVKIHVY